MVSVGNRDVIVPARDVPAWRKTAQGGTQYSLQETLDGGRGDGQGPPRMQDRGRAAAGSVWWYTSARLIRSGGDRVSHKQACSAQGA